MARMQWFHKIVSAFFLTTLVAGLATHALAADPKFNFLPGDRETFTGRNTTKAQADPTDPVAADANDEVEGILYYHNGIEDSVAMHTVAKVTLPTAVASQHVLQGTISADNAAPVTDNFTINASSATNLEFIPGSVRWFPDNSATPVPLLNGQTGAELFTAGGLNLGDTTGCWAHAGLVMFKVKLKSPVQGQPQLKLVKQAHVGAGQTPFGDMWNKAVTANQGDNVHFRLTITNPGSTKVDVVTIKDILPDGLSFVPNSAFLFTDADINGHALSGDIAKGIDVGVLQLVSSPNGPTKLTVIFTAKVASNLPCGDNQLVNTAAATGAGLISSDIAKVTVTVSGPQCQGQPRIEKSKRAFNDTQHVDATTVVAHAGDQITYTLTTKNTGSGDQSQFVIDDGIRDILDYADVVSISDNGKTIDQPTDQNRDNQVIVRYPAVDIKAAASVDRTFTVKVKNPVPTTAQNGNAFDFVMFNVYGNEVKINVERPGVVSLNIQKDVRNITKNEGAFVDSDTGSPGDLLEYQAKFKNNGNKVVTGVLKDVLPNGVTFVDNSITVKKGSDVIATTGNLFGDGLSIPGMTQGTEFTLTFRVNTSDKLADSTNLVNKASISAEGQTKEDTASTLILNPPKPTTVPPVTQAPPPTQSSLPSAGADPFTIMFVLSGGVYTWLTRRRLNKEFTNLSSYVNIV